MAFIVCSSVGYACTLTLSELLLLVVAYATAQVSDLADEADFLGWCFVSAGSWKHVADFADPLFLCRSIEIRAIHLAIGVLKLPDILPQIWLGVVASHGHDLA